MDDVVHKRLRDFISSGEGFELTFQYATTILQHIQHAVSGYGDAEPKQLAETFRLFAEKVLAAFVKGLEGDKTAPLPEVLRAGPVAALQALQGLFDLLGQLGRLQGVRDRIALADYSLRQLTGTQPPAGVFPDNEFLNGKFPGDSSKPPFDGLNRLLRLPADVLGGGDPATLVEGILRSGLVYPWQSILGALGSARDQQLWAWTDLPASLAPGRLGAWVNDAGTYLNAPGTPLHLLERQFRVRLVAAFDARFPARPGDRRGDAAVAAELACLLFETVTPFLLEPDCYPAADGENEGIEDVGSRFAALAARQVRDPVRAGVGLLLRGTGFWPVGDAVAVEMIGAVLGSAFSAVLEGVLRNLTWTLRVTSRYQRDAPAGGPFAHRWDSLETAENTGAGADRLAYVAVVRGAADGAPVVNLPPVLRGLLEDCGAYLDVCYRRFPLEDCFPTVAPVDTIDFPEPPQLLGDRLVVLATTNAEPPVPRPVLRAYFCCHSAPLRPDKNREGLYEVEIRLPVVPRHCFDVTVLSNRGGVKTATVARA